MNTSFNLIEEKWIPCHLPDRSIQKFGFFEILARAHEIKQFVSNLPMGKIALIRVLLAILHRNFGPKSTQVWRAIWQERKFDAKTLSKYFTDWHDRFDLFHETHPFYQTRDIQAEIRPVNGYRFHLGLFHIAGGSKGSTLFNHHTENMEISFSPAEAALQLLFLQSFCFGFSQKGWKDGPSARGINFHVIGNNLFETLMLNLIRYDKYNPFKILEDDAPAWEQNNAFSPVRVIPNGYLDYLTWQSRKILFHYDEISKTINKLQVDKGLVLDASDEQCINPMISYKTNKDNGNSPFIPLKFQGQKVLWRDSYAILGTGSGNNISPKAIDWVYECGLKRDDIQISAIGISSGKIKGSSIEGGIGKVNFYREEYFKFPHIFLNNDLLLGYLDSSLKHAEEIYKILLRSISRLIKELSIDDERGEKNINNHLSSKNQYWYLLETPFHQFIYDLPNTGTSAIDQWIRILKFSSKKTYSDICNFIGNSPKALKASALGRCALEREIKNFP